MKMKRGPGAISDDQRRTANMLMRERPGIGPTELSRQTGIALNTAKAWIKKFKAEVPASGITDRAEPVRISEVIDDLQRSAAAGSEIIRRHMEKSLDELLQAIANGGDVPVTTMREIKGLAETMGSLVSQMKSLQGEPTSLSTVLDASPDQLDSLLLDYIQQACDSDKSLRGRILTLLNAPKAQPPAAKQTDPQLLEEGDEDLIDDDGHDGHPGDYADGYPGVPGTKLLPPATETQACQENGGRMDDMLDLEEARKILKIGRNTMYRLVQSGEVKARKVGKNWRINRRDLVAYQNGGGK